jgi:hypothetical protein
LAKKWLADRIYPDPIGTDYQYTDLLNRAIVEELFNYCQIFGAILILCPIFKLKGTIAELV